jgi:RHS repeat-associated protein
VAGVPVVLRVASSSLRSVVGMRAAARVRPTRAGVLLVAISVVLLFGLGGARAAVGTFGAGGRAASPSARTRRAGNGPDRPRRVGRVVVSIMAFAHRFHTASGHEVVRTRRRHASSFRSPRRLSAFSQCPAVGNDTSCGVLVTVTDSGTQVQSDPSQGPFDGVEDTLIGVQNNSSGSIGSLVLSANTDLFGFDGDGLCSGVNSGGRTPFYPPPAGCPFGPTTYEGPGTSYSNINPSLTGGVVNFTNGLAPGASAYFSLEESLTGATVYTGGPSASEQGGPSSNPSENSTGASCGKPVNCATGTFWHQWDDLRVPGRGVPLDFQRTYSSAAAATDGPLGFGWTDSYNMSLAVDQASGNVTISQENGSTVTFNPNGSGGYVAAPRVLAKLVKNGDGTYTFTRNADLVHYTFSAAGQLLKEVDRNGYTTTLGYSGSQLTSVTDPAGRTLTFTYSGSHIATVTGPGSHSESFTYVSGNLASATDAAGGVWSFTYDASHRLLTMQDPRSGVTTNVYDASGRVTSQTDPMNRATTWSYSGNNASPAGGTTTVTDPKGNVTNLNFANLELLSKTRGVGTSSVATTSYGYDPATLGITSITDPDNHTSTATYDASGNQISFTDALNRRTTATYNSLNEPLAVTDPSNVTTSRTYDAAGNLLTVSRPLNGTVTKTISSSYGDANHPGDVTGVTDPNGHVSTLTYDSQGDLASITDPLGDKTTFTYDSFGERISSVSPRGNAFGADPNQYTTSYSYDALGRLTQTTDPLGHISKQTYDADSNLASSVDGKNNTTSYTYNADNQLTKITRADTTTVQYGYDADGNQTSQTDGANHTTSYAYDPLNRLSSITDPLNRTTSSGYDAAGNRTSLTDAGGQRTTYGYDADNELTSITYSDGRTPNAGFTYNSLGFRASMTDGTGTTTYTYDQLNRRTGQTNGAGQVVSYGYDLNDNLISITYPNGRTVSRSYDVANRLASITDWLGHTTNFTDDADSNITGTTYPNAVTATNTFDAADQLNNVADKNAGGTTLASFAYTRDANGQLTSTTPTGTGQGSNETYGYNSLDELTAVNTNTATFDAADNITRLTNGATLGYDAANQATSYTPAGGTASTLGYDQRGDRLTGLNGAGYSYDQAKRLVTFTAARTAGSVAAGGAHSLGLLTSDGTVWAWGTNHYGQLGNGTTVDSSVPVQVSNLTNVTAVSAGDAHSLALKNDGTVWAWGHNEGGQLGIGTTSINSTVPVRVSNLTSVSAVAAGHDHSVALKSDGTVWGWGYNRYGQLGNGSNTDSSVPVQVITGNHSFLTGVTKIAAGNYHSLALKSDGTVWAWGSNALGELGNNSTTDSNKPVQVRNLTGVTAIAGGGDNSFAVKSDGTVWDWGSNSNGQLGNGTLTSSSVPVQVHNLTGVVSVASAGGTAFARKSDGTVWAWGSGINGVLGNGGTSDSSVPVQVSISGVSALGGGPDAGHALALKSDGTIWAWGSNFFGQLGNGTTTNSSVPVRVTGLSQTTSYTYDGDGLRATSTANGVTQHFAWDLSGGLPCLLTDGSTNYIYDDAGLPVEQIDSSGTPLYYQHDQLGSTRLLTDGSGAVAATFSYDAYGNLTSHTGASDTPLRWGGHYQDVTGLYYLRARYYDPQTAQFLTRDPLVPLTQEPYGYSMGNPLNWADPLGLGCGWTSPWDCVWDALKWAWNEVTAHAADISTLTANLALAAAIVGCEPCAGVLGGISLVTGAIATGKEIKDGDYTWAAIDGATALLGASGPLAKLLDEAATITWDANRLALAAKAARSRDLLERLKFQLDSLSVVLTDIEAEIKALQEAKKQDPCTAAAA